MFACALDVTVGWRTIDGVDKIKLLPITLAAVFLLFSTTLHSLPSASAEGNEAGALQVTVNSDARFGGHRTVSRISRFGSHCAISCLSLFGRHCAVSRVSRFGGNCTIGCIGRFSGHRTIRDIAGLRA